MRTYFNILTHYLIHQQTCPLKTHTHTHTHNNRNKWDMEIDRGVLSVTVIIVGIGINNKKFKPGWHCFVLMVWFCFVLFWFGLVLWHINHYRLLNAKFIFIHINSSISNNSVTQKYTVSMLKYSTISDNSV